MMYWRDVNCGSNACCVHTALIQTKFQIPTIPSPPTPIPACVCVCEQRVSMCVWSRFNILNILRSIRKAHLALKWTAWICTFGSVISVVSDTFALIKRMAHHCDIVSIVSNAFVWKLCDGNSMGIQWVIAKIARPFRSIQGTEGVKGRVFISFLVNFLAFSILFNWRYYTEWVLCIGNGNKEISEQQTQ